MKVTERQAFAAGRRTVLDDAERQLQTVVEEALRNWSPHGDWYSSRVLPQVNDLFGRVFREESGEATHPNLGDAEDQLHSGLVRSLAKTTRPDEGSVERITRFLATATVNAATKFAAEVDADSDNLVLEWVTMHDNDVRTTHREADGQRRRQGERFHVGSSELEFPGDPEGLIADWINCRCVLRPDYATAHAMTASSNPNAQKASVIVALPSDGHPMYDVAAEQPHVTLCYLGDAASINDATLQQIKDGVANVANSQAAFSDPVNGRATLGSDSADVLLLDGHNLTGVRRQLMQHSAISDTMKQAGQHPNFIPHATVGYPQDSYGDPSGIDSLAFDRLALWHGDEQTEYPLGGTMTSSAGPAPIPWHGVLAPMGSWSGDKRRFKEGSLRHRDTPLPLTWQEKSAEGHDGSAVVAKIDRIWTHGNLLKGEGTFLQTPDADKAIGLMADFGKFGVSVDIDDAAFDLEPEDGGVTFSDARVCSASIVPIPAFAEAWVALGPWDAAEAGYPEGEPATFRSETFASVSEKSWDGSASRFTPQQWKRSCVLHLSDSMSKSDHKLPIREPDGALSRAGVHAAAARLNQTDAPASAKAAAKAAIRSAYKQLGEDPPEGFGLQDPESFGRGPGWVTNPKGTEELHHYWVEGEGAAKIRWGEPNDFYRCRDQVGEEIGESSPATLRFINQICAQWHHDAIGEWPGQEDGHHGNRGHHDGEAEVFPSVTIVASGGGWCAPSEWFEDPKLNGLTPLQLREVDGHWRIFGHLAGWSTCHVDYPGTCVTPPRSASNYAYFKTGEVLTSNGPIPCGNLTLGGGHAHPELGIRGALAHYDSTSSVVADVNIGEDEHGPWVAGALRGRVTDEQRDELRAAALSGDWRKIRGQYELIAALAVNVPGFPIPRPQVGVRNGEQVSLVAAGAVPQLTFSGPAPEAVVDAPVAEPTEEMLEQYLAEREQRRAKIQAIGERVLGQERTEH